MNTRPESSPELPIPDTRFGRLLLHLGLADDKYYPPDDTEAVASPDIHARTYNRSGDLVSDEVLTRE